MYKNYNDVAQISIEMNISIKCIKVLIRKGANLKAMDAYHRLPRFYAIDVDSRQLLSGSGTIQVRLNVSTDCTKSSIPFNSLNDL